MRGEKSILLFLLVIVFVVGTTPGCIFGKGDPDTEVTVTVTDDPAEGEDADDEDDVDEEDVADDDDSEDDGDDLIDDDEEDNLLACIGGGESPTVIFTCDPVDQALCSVTAEGPVATLGVLFPVVDGQCSMDGGPAGLFGVGGEQNDEAEQTTDASAEAWCHTYVNPLQVGGAGDYCAILVIDPSLTYNLQGAVPEDTVVVYFGPSWGSNPITFDGANDVNLSAADTAFLCEGSDCPGGGDEGGEEGGGGSTEFIALDGDTSSEGLDGGDMTEDVSFWIGVYEGTCADNASSGINTAVLTASGHGKHGSEGLDRNGGVTQLDIALDDWAGDHTATQGNPYAVYIYFMYSDPDTQFRTGGDFLPADGDWNLCEDVTYDSGDTSVRVETNEWSVDQAI